MSLDRQYSTGTFPSWFNLPKFGNKSR